MYAALFFLEYRKCSTVEKESRKKNAKTVEVLFSMKFYHPCTGVSFSCGYELPFHLTATPSRNMINMLGQNPGPWHRQIIEF